MNSVQKLRSLFFRTRVFIYEISIPTTLILLQHQPPLNAPLPLPANRRNNRRHPARPCRPRFRQNAGNHRENPPPDRKRNKARANLSPHLLRQSRRGDAGTIRKTHEHRRAHGEHLPRVRALGAGGQCAGLGDQLLVGDHQPGEPAGVGA